jgi:release factor glutamine methyltransferase
MRVNQWLSISRKIFNDTDLRFLVKNVFLKESIALLDKEEVISSEKLQALDTIKALYVQGMPLAYILGREEFFGLTFCVDKRTLIPRKETELVAEKAISVIKSNNITSVLDLCCGCANIAIAIDKSIDKKVDIFASDISFEALEVSLQNKIFNASFVRLVNSNLFDAFKEDSFDLIVSNPPYVESLKIKGSLNYEPYMALDAGSDGLDYIRKILDEAVRYLKNNGLMIVEFGYRHKPFIEDIIINKGCYNIEEWIKDYSGNWRGVVLGKL